jgi:hypothetical protein
MAVVTWTGTHTPFGPPEDYATFGAKTPALHGFRLTHLKTDHQLVDIAVRVGGNPVELTPNADEPTPIPVLDGDLDVHFQDASPRGDEFGYTVSHSTLSIGARRYQIRDVGCVNECKRTLPPALFGGRLGLPAPSALGGYLLALTGFRMYFTGNRNHEVERIGIWFEGHDLHVALRDHSGNDTFAYLADFVVIPTAGLTVKTGSGRGTGAQAFETFALKTPPRSHFVIRGWELEYTQGDRELLDIGVLGSDQGFTVFLGDQGGDDLFDWRVDWAHIGTPVFAPIG